MGARAKRNMLVMGLVVGLGLVGAMLVGSGDLCAQTISPRRLVEVADLSAPTLSPDGRLVAFRVERASIERNTYDSVWYVQDLAGGPPRRVADGGVPLRDGGTGSVPAPASWSADGRYIYYRAFLEGRIDVWRAAADGSGAGPVTLDPANVRDFSLHEGGRKVRYQVGATREEIIRAEQDEYDRGIHVTADVPVGAPLFRSHFIDGELRTQRYTGEGWARGTLLSGPGQQRWREIDPETRAVRDLAAAELEAGPPAVPRLPGETGEPLVAVRAPDGSVAALLQSAGEGGDPGGARPERLRIVVFPGGAADAAVVCQAEACTDRPITNIQWRPGAQEVLFTVTDRAMGLAQSVFRWVVATGEVLPVTASPGLLGGGRDHRSGCGVSARSMVCVVAQASVPPRLEQVDLETGQRRVLFQPNAALEHDLAATIGSRLLTWRDRNGQEFSGHLFTGRGLPSAPGPLFINFYHCAGFLRGGLGDEWPLASLAEHGIAALCINAPPYHPDPLVRYNHALGAVESVVDLLAAEGVVDPGAVGMGGLSFGSETALWVAMESDLLRAVSVTAPLVSPLYYLIGSLRGDIFFSALRRNWGLGTPGETPDQWRRLSPVDNIDRIRTPVLFQMAEEEYIYALDYLVPLMRGDRADLYVFPEEPHQKFQPRHKQAAYARNLDWFRFWLQGVKDGHPAKAAQYARWEQMKAAGAGAPVQ